MRTFQYFWNLERLGLGRITRTGSILDGFGSSSTIGAFGRKGVWGFV
jgi:hypothetical protein